jgi:hypothetical protein
MYQNKYLKYKNKYFALKSELSGGKFEVGTTKDKDLTHLITSDLTLIQAHGSVNIQKWYSLPDNVYLLTTSDIGGVTCSIYNNVFDKLMNDSIDRTQLKEILQTTSDKKVIDSKKIVQNIYSGGNIIYEPGDLIPIIDLSFHHNNLDNSAKVIYGIFKFEEYDESNKTKTNIFSDYDNLMRQKPEENVNRSIRCEIGKSFNKNILIDMITKIKNFGSGWDFKIEVAFNNFLINHKYKKYFNDPNSLDFDNIRDTEDCKFVTMCISLYYQEYKNIYTYTIKEIIDRLDKTKPQLIVLTSCLHTKNVYMEIYKSKSFSTTLDAYNELTKTRVKKGEYFENKTFLPYYKVTQEEQDNLARLLQIYNDWNENKEEIKHIIQEQITKINNVHEILFNCIESNNHNVIKLISQYLSITSDDLLNTLQLILKSSMSGSNDALVEFFKFKYWYYNPNIRLGDTSKTIYEHFIDVNKLELWDALLVNNFEIYKKEDWTEIKITDKLLLEKYDDDFKDINQRINFIKLYFTDSELIDELINKWEPISSSVLYNIEQLDKIIISNIDTTKLIELLNKIITYEEYHHDSKLSSILNEVFSRNGINLYNMTISAAIDLISEIKNIKTIENIIKKFINNDIDLNNPNDNGYNLYSYIVASHECSVARTKLNEYNSRDLEYLNKAIMEAETKLATKLEILKKYDLKPNKDFPEESLPKNVTRNMSLIIDGIKCKNYFG